MFIWRRWNVDFLIVAIKAAWMMATSIKINLQQFPMRYLVRARVKADREADLLQAIEAETLGQGSVAEGEYLRNMQDARWCSDQTARWVEVCYCPTPLEEERPYWEQYFELTRVQDAHDRRRCRDHHGSQPLPCGDSACSAP